MLSVRPLVFIAFFLLLVAALPAHARFEIGDMVIAQAGNNAAPGHLDWYRNGTLVRRIEDLQAFFEARFDLVGTLYASPGGALLRYDRDAVPAGSVYAPGGFAGTIVIDGAGNFYTGQWDERRIAKISPAGELLRTYDISSLPRGTPATADLASDQCTLFFTVPRVRIIGRYDLCSGLRLSDLTTTLPADPDEIRLLSDGTLLVAAGQNVYRLNSAGSIVQTYSAGPAEVFGALAIEPSGQAFWASSGAQLIQFRLRDGTILGRLITPQDAASIAIFGDPWAATGGAAIPTFHPSILIALLLALAAAGSLAILRE